MSGSIGLDVGDRLQSGARKLKYVVNGPLPGDHAFPSFRDFEVRFINVFLINRPDRKSQVVQCFGFCTADFWSLLAYESAEQKPKHCLI